MNYVPVEMSRKQTEAKIEQVDKQIEMLGQIPDDIISRIDARKMILNLQSLKRQLYRDLKYWDECDAAIEEAVK